MPRLPRRRSVRLDELAGEQAGQVLELDQLAGSADLGLDLETRRLEGGLRIARSLLWLIALVLVAIAGYAALTYPSLADIKTLKPPQTSLGESYEQVRGVWFTQIKDLVQLLVLSLLVPLLTSLIGFLFGQQVGPTSPPDSQ